MTSESDQALDGPELAGTSAGDKSLRGVDLPDTRMQLKKKQQHPAKLVEKSVIVHRDENGFGLRIKGQAPIFVEHVHENGAAWRAGVRRWDRISKVNGTPVSALDHKQVVLMFKSCNRFVSLTLISNCQVADPELVYCCIEQQHGAHQDHYESKKSSQGQLINSMLFNAGRRSTLGPVGQAQLGWKGNSLLEGQHSTNNRHSFAHHRLAPESDVTGAEMTTCFQQAVARRSESVAVRPSYLSQFELVAGRHQIAEQQAERRISATDLCVANCRAQFCIGCRALLKDPELQGVCGDCSHKSSSGVARKLGPANIPQALEQQRQRVYGSMKDPNHRAEMGPRQQVNGAAQDRLGRNFHRLSQSASMVSLSRSEARQSETKQATNDIKTQVISNKNAANSLAFLQIDCTRPVNRRLEVIREFIDTERTHTERLRYLDELFYRPLKTGELINGEQLRMVFSCHRTLYKIHRQIYRILLSANYNLYAEPLIGSALLEIFEGDLRRRLEKAACTFCAAQSTNVELLNKLTRRDTKVGEFLAQVTSQQMIGRLGIKDLLASCFQRLTKYPLLLESLLKATPQIPLPSPTPSNSGKLRRKRLCNNHLSSGAEVSNLAQPYTSSAKFNVQTVDCLANIGPERRQEQDSEDQEEEKEEEEKEEEDQEEEEEEEARNARRMLAISLAEEREFISRALHQSRQILVRVNETIKEAISHNKLKEIWKRTDKYPGVPLIDISKQQVVHEGLLTLRLSKRSFDVYVLLLNDYIIILTREGQDKYRLKFFTPEGKSSSSLSSSGSQTAVYSPVFVIDEHLTTRDAATDENGFYLLCKRKDDSRIYEFASRSPAERIKWRDRIQWTIERQMNKADRRPSCESTVTKSSSEISAKHDQDETIEPGDSNVDLQTSTVNTALRTRTDLAHRKQLNEVGGGTESDPDKDTTRSQVEHSRSSFSEQPTKIEGTISYVEDDGIVLPSKMESSQALVDRAIQVNIFETMRNQQITATS